MALRFAEGETEKAIVTPEDVGRPARAGAFHCRSRCAKRLPAGVATGLAWTETGGDVLYVESALLPDGKGLTLTGQLGEVMQESAKAAQSYIWSHADDLGHRSEAIQEQRRARARAGGAIPKDGPSAGVTMTRRWPRSTQACRRAATPR